MGTSAISIFRHRADLRFAQGHISCEQGFKPKPSGFGHVLLNHTLLPSSQHPRGKHLRELRFPDEELHEVLCTRWVGDSHRRHPIPGVTGECGFPPHHTSTPTTPTIISCLFKWVLRSLKSTVRLPVILHNLPTTGKPKALPTIGIQHGKETHTKSDFALDAKMREKKEEKKKNPQLPFLRKCQGKLTLIFEISLWFTLLEVNQF